MRITPELAGCGATVPTPPLNSSLRLTMNSSAVQVEAPGANFNPYSRSVQILEPCPAACIITRARDP